MSPEARDHSFDELTRGLASGTLSRGKALRLMGAALVGGALASIPGIAWAKPKPAGAKCNHNHQCASGQCVDSRGGRVCSGGGGCPGCPVPPEGLCICVEDLRNPGVQVCASGIGFLVLSGDCNECGAAVCIPFGDGAVACHGPCT
jgi:hypothetical protein